GGAEGGERGVVVRDPGCHAALDGGGGVGVGVAHRHVQPEADRGRRVVVVDVDAVLAHGEAGLQGHRLAVDAIDRHLVRVGAGPEPGYRGQAGGAAVVEDVPGEVVDLLELELVHHRNQPPAAHLIGRDQR